MAKAFQKKNLEEEKPRKVEMCDGSGHDKELGVMGARGTGKGQWKNTDLQTKVGLNHHREAQFFYVLANKQSLKSAEQVCSRSKVEL